MDKRRLEEVIIHAAQSTGDAFVDVRDRVYDEVASNAAQTERNFGVEIMVDSLIEVKADDTTIIGLLQKYWGLTYDEAASDLRTIKTITHPKKMLNIYLRTEGYSDSEIRKYMLSKNVGAELKANHELWKLSPEKLKKKLEEK